jgi:lipopolysaccharide exporter
MSQAEVDQFDAAPPDPDGPNLTALTASGLRWSYLGFAGLMLANLAYTATMSRLLSPADFGLMALANLVVLFGQFFAHMGLSSALVHKRNLSTDEIRAASTAGIVFGVACFAVVWLLTPAFSAVFRQPDLSPVLRTLSVSFLIVGWSTTGEGLLRREHRFRQLSTLTIGSYVFGYLIVGIGSALLGAGVWSLVAASLVATALMAGWRYALVRHPIRPALRWQPYRTVCGFGMRLSGAHLLDYVGSNLDTLVVGRFASTAVLGQYTRAYYVVFQPIGNYAAQALTSVLFASLSRIQHEMARLGRAYLSLLSLGGVVLFPVCTGVAVAAPQFVLVVLGPGWDQVTGMVPWFALAGGFNVLSKLSQSLAEVRAELNRSLALQAAYLAVLGALLGVAVAFRSHGPWVFAAAVAGAEGLRHVGYLAFVRRILGLSLPQMVRSYAPAALASAGVALGVAAARWALVGEAPTLAVFVAEIGAGALALALCIRFGPLPDLRRELWLRLTAAGALGAVGGWRWRLAPLVLGRPDPTMLPEPRP